MARLWTPRMRKPDTIFEALEIIGSGDEWCMGQHQAASHGKALARPLCNLDGELIEFQQCRLDDVFVLDFISALPAAGIQQAAPVR